ncbi:MAG: glycerophosphodiester phosphodiesterase [Acidimicrobiales bacterium]|nr:glycerophosphodiester phosphodiesterase [Acidimicrobiales bacterium]
MALVIAHRGASATHPENTVEAFRAAAEQGADWVELDVRRAACGALVVHHDAHLADGRLIGDHRADDLPSAVPSLAEALEACGSMGVNIEVKNMQGDPDYDDENVLVDAVVGVSRAYLELDRVLLSSFNMDAMDKVRSIDTEVPAAWITMEIIDAGQAVERALAHGLQAINPYFGLVTSTLVEKAHAAGLKVFPWTVDDPEEAHRLLDAGVDGIVSNVPATLREIVDDYRE